MGNPKQVAILGTSAVMTGLAGALGRRGEFSVRLLDSIGDLTGPGSATPLDLLIVDAAAVDPGQVLAIVRRHAVQAVIGIDLQHRQAVTLFSNTRPLGSINDLAGLIEVMAGPSFRASDNSSDLLSSFRD